MFFRLKLRQSYRLSRRIRALKLGFLYLRRVVLIMRLQLSRSSMDIASVDEPCRVDSMLVGLLILHIHW